MFPAPPSAAVDWQLLRLAGVTALMASREGVCQDSQLVKPRRVWMCSPYCTVWPHVPCAQVMLEVLDGSAAVLVAGCVPAARLPSERHKQQHATTALLLPWVVWMWASCGPLALQHIVALRLSAVRTACRTRQHPGRTSVEEQYILAQNSHKLAG